MSENRVLGIVGANIYGLEGVPMYSILYDSYAKTISFFNNSCGGSKYLNLYFGKDEKTALETWYKIKVRLEELSIKEGSRVLFFCDEKSGNVIGVTHVNAEAWLDVRKDFEPQKFMQLIAHYDEAIMRRYQEGLVFY